MELSSSTSRFTNEKPPATVLPKSSVSMTAFALERASKVLVIYTGGTIGKGVNPDGGKYVTRLDEKLAEQPIFHDEAFATAYTDALADSSKSPRSSVTDETSGPSDNVVQRYTSRILAMPEDKFGRRVLYNLLEYRPLLHSSKVSAKDYANIATDIMLNYEDYDGFVILHGTDTMAYTASALSFMLENLGKPVILTGSQIPILETLSDGRSNFLTALTLAAHHCIPEVTIFFLDKLIRGCCATKCDTASMDAFTSPNCPALVEVGINITVNWPILFTQPGRAMKKFGIEKRICPDVGVLRLFPMMTAANVDVFCRPPIKGIVLQCYGAGNVPDPNTGVMTAIREAVDCGMLFLCISQCFRGGIVDSVETGTCQALLDAGVILGFDMTTECALMKLSYILGKEEWDLEKKRKMLARPLRGEFHRRSGTSTTNTGSRKLESQNALEQFASSVGLDCNSTKEMSGFVESLFPTLLCNAAKDNEVEVLKALLQLGASVTLSDYGNRTPLHIACSNSSTESVQFLLEQGSPVDVFDRLGNTPLLDAVRGRNLAIIQMLRAAGAKLNMASSLLAHELCSSAAQNDVSQLEAWVLSGADVNAPDINSQRPLYAAVRWNRLEAVEFLLRNHADPSIGSGKHDETPLALAQRRPDILIRIHDMLERAASIRLAASKAYFDAIGKGL